MIQHPIVKRKIHFLPYNTDFRYCLAYIHYLSQWLVRCVYVRYCFHLCLSSLLLVLWFCHNFKPKGSNAYTWHDRHAHTHTHIVYFEKKPKKRALIIIRWIIKSIITKRSSGYTHCNSLRWAKWNKNQLIDLIVTLGLHSMVIYVNWTALSGFKLLLDM